MSNEIITFWFEELKPKQWWVKDEELDRLITQRFSSIHRQASLGELASWRNDPQGQLAEIIILDQFSRNIYRNTPHSFAHDGQALTLAQFAIVKGQDLELAPSQRAFLYMPFMHSESSLIHKEAVKLFTQLGNPEQIKFEQLHKDIIDRFGRYPHRNQILGRKSSSEEIEFLKSPNSSF